jgi:hypothetical protein
MNFPMDSIHECYSSINYCILNNLLIENSFRSKQKKVNRNLNESFILLESPPSIGFNEGNSETFRHKM